MLQTVEKVNIYLLSLYETFPSKKKKKTNKKSYKKFLIKEEHKKTANIKLYNMNLGLVNG